MKATVFIEDSFDSAHDLTCVPEDHKCRRLHGHTYHIRIEVTGYVSMTSGWVIDYAEIKAAWEPVKAMLDHRYLNDIEGLSISTCENLAIWILARLQTSLPQLSRVEIRETEHCGASVPCQ